MLAIQDLHVTYGGAVRALRGVSLEVPDGAVFGVLGSNGAGKTTLLRAISGTIEMNEGKIVQGSIELDGRPLPANPRGTVRAGVLQVPEGRRVFGRLTVEENLRVGGFSVRNGAERSKAHDRVLELFPILRERAQQRAGLLSGGEQQMLAIGRALMASPKVLLLDEPSLGLAPRIVAQISEVITDINRQGTTVILVEQNASMALKVASVAAVFELGRVAEFASAEQLASDADLRERYLGGTTEITHDAEDVPVLARWER